MNVNELLIVAIAAQAVTAAAPLVLAGLGELVAERAGVIDVGIEGLMLTGCIAAFAAGACGAGPLLALAAAVGAAVALAGVFAVVAVILGADQIVTGMAMNLLAFGGSATAWQVLQAHGHDQLPASAGFERGIPGLQNLPVAGPILFDQYALSYGVVVLAIAIWWMLRRTRAGLIVRALGDAPEAGAAAGIGVLRSRALCVLFAGACAGAAGAYLSIMRTHGFAPEMTGGQGFLVLALVIFGRWSVPGLVAGCLFFGALESVQQHLQGVGLNRFVPYQIFKALPYLAALAALVFLSRSAPGPARLGEPWTASR